MTGADSMLFSSEWDEPDPGAADRGPEPVADASDTDATFVGDGAGHLDIDDDTPADPDDQPSASPRSESAEAVGVDGESDGSRLVFGSLQAFVERYLLQTYRRAAPSAGMTWCPEWWRHPEAVVRLEALWRSWEYLRLDPATGISVWMRDHCDPHMARLLSADGCLRGCKPTGHARALKPLPAAPVPTGWFDNNDRAGLPQPPPTSP